MKRISLVLVLFMAACGGGGGGSSSGGGASTTTTAPGATTPGSGSVTPGSNPGTPSTPAALPTSLPTGSWFGGDFHSHSSPHSDDARKQFGDNVQKCVSLANLQGLDFWCLTDHRTVSGHGELAAAASGTLKIGGEEWGSGAHANCIGITTEFPEIDRSLGANTWNAQAQAAIDDAHQQGGIFIINHPTRKSPWIFDVQGFDAIEVWNTFWAFRQNVELTQGQAVNATAPLTAAGSPHNAALDYATSFRVHKREQAVKFWEYYLNNGTRVPATGGGDRHMLNFPGYPTTRVFTDNRTQQGILDAVRAGRVYITNHPQGPALEFTADGNGDGIPDAMIGSEVPKGAPVDFTVKVTNAVAGEVVIIKNGQIFASQKYTVAPFNFQFTDTPQQGDWWRVDVYEDTDLNSANASLLNVALSSQWAGFDYKNPSFYLFLLNTYNLVGNVSLNTAVGTTLPTVDWTRDQIRILNADVANPNRSRAIISSPIYAQK
ncbi:MAG: CehA/McbA family metallohydrolase [Planctomycetota bacterium]|nr:CehA/McbA family metallohydrolase [Planctomycetota bacterium]